MVIFNFHLAAIIIGLLLSTTFIVLICMRLSAVSPRELELRSELGRQPEHTIKGLESIKLATFPTMVYNMEALHSIEDIQYDTDAGSFFVKTNRGIGPSMFEGEAIGLSAMYATNSIRVPKPYKVGALPTGGSFIIMEFIEFGMSRGDQSVLGRKLAEMHKAAKSEKGFGFDVDNTIGSTPQINTWTSDWVEFYAEHRLGYQLKLVLKKFGDSIIYEKGQRLMKNLRPLFEGVVIEPCLLHGDLWSGNISADKKGNPVILDPACYYGHNEAEFGMSWCAGFGGSFYNSYFEVMLKQPGFENRRDLYMLYHYLNHYNLFGSGYRSSAMSIIDDYLRIFRSEEDQNRKYRGIRCRSRKWVSEIREPRKAKRIWLGTYPRPEMAAVAYDVAALALKGGDAVLNFPECVGCWAAPVSLSPGDIRAAAEAAAAAVAVRMEREKSGEKEVVFVDEEELFDMPFLLMNMAEGMLMSPPRLSPTWSDDHSPEVSEAESTLWSYS
ncbi:hypothetical protein J5N97_016534 [Dioscorea zingiberensis]|uniref:Protein-ribulosamine 3-kinase, chloroplastic n=1 Tax=Dioscorea zingiberensis TaxID=325984 RepID=A0A9D5HFH1_9LILI|nr:hypothetical protein J5N97_016534 [Dioscorea zingiberensis]